MSMKTTDPLPGTNTEGMDLMAEYLSAERAKGFRATGLTLVQGHREGVRIRDLDGNEFINCRCSGGVFNFGHRPAFAIEALKHALNEFGDMGDWLLPSAVRARGAGALASVLPGDLRYVFFTPGGAEAVEVACKLARGVTGRTEFVTAESGYHGHIGFSLAMDEARDSHWFAPLVPGIVKVPFGDADAVDGAVTDRTAAVCMETVPATAGYLVPPDAFWPRVRSICDERGALLILDEVQAGLGRTGAMWACDHWGVVPDILVTGKCLSGGVYPIAACCFGERVDAFFAQDPFFHPSSYGGSELGAAVVEAVVDQLSAPGFLEQVGWWPVASSAAWTTCAPGSRPSSPDDEASVSCRRWTAPTSSNVRGIDGVDHQVMASWRSGPTTAQETLLIMPPLVITESDVDDIVAGIGAAAAEVADSAMMEMSDLMHARRARWRGPAHSGCEPSPARRARGDHHGARLADTGARIRLQTSARRLIPCDAASAYGAVVERYIDELRRRGVRVVDTEVTWIERPDGRVIVYHVQPALAPETLGLDILRRSTPERRSPTPLLSGRYGRRRYR